MTTTEKTYIVVGTNNYWYATFTAETLDEAIKNFTDVRKDVEAGEYFDMDVEAPYSVYLYEAKQIGAQQVRSQEEIQAEEDAKLIQGFDVEPTCEGCGELIMEGQAHAGNRHATCI